MSNERTRRVTIALLAALIAIPSVALATDPAIRDLERKTESIVFSVTGDDMADAEQLKGCLAILHEILRAADELPEDLQAQGRIRVAEANLRLAGQLMAIPVPGELTEEQGTIFRGELADHAEPLVMAASLAAGIVQMDIDMGGLKLPGPEKRRLIAFFAAATEMDERVQAWKQTPRLFSLEDPEPRPPRPEPAPPAPIPEGWAPPPNEDTPDASFALVWGNATLRRSPDDPEPVRMYDFPDEERESYPDAIYAVRVLGENDDGLLEVRLGGNTDWNSHCVGTSLLEHWVAVRGWIEPDDRVRVVAEDEWVDFPDGTGVRLMAGTPIVGDQGWLNGQLVLLPAGVKTALEYAGDANRLEQSFGPGRISWTTEGTLGGEPFAVRQPAFDHGDDLGLSSWEATENGTLARYTRRCGEVRFLTDAPVTEDDTAGILGALMGSDDRVRVEAGTPLYWVDGQPAGQAGPFGTSFQRWQLFGVELRCVEVPVSNLLDDRRNPTVPICVRPEDVQSP